MSDRLLTLGFALAALMAFFYFFIGPARNQEPQGSRPLTSESRPNGYQGARLWLESQHVAVDALRHRYDWLEGAGNLPKQGNLLITTIPFQRPMRRGELEVLREWILKGNSVLVAAGLFDTPEWAVPEIDTFGDLRGVTGLTFRDVTPAPPPEEDVDPEANPPANPPADLQALIALQRLPHPKRGVLRPNGRHPLTAGVEAVFADSEYAAGKFAAITPAGSPLLSLMLDNESGLGALWLTPFGKGTVVVSGYGSIFTNKLLDQAGNARLLGNAVEQLLGPGGHVVFDDVHQGAADFYDAEAFFADSRLHASFWWIIGLWLIWVLGGTRLPPPAAAPATVREQAFMAATGNFLARVIDRKRIAQRMMANFFNEFRKSLDLPADGKPLWPWMRGIATLEPGLLERVEALLRARRGRETREPDRTAQSPATTAETTPMTTPVERLEQVLRAEIGRVAHGLDGVIHGLLIACIARGHVLVEGAPGLGKTLVAKALARCLGGSFQRIQGTADLMPSDIIGVHVFDPREQKFSFRPGPLFADVVLMDEVNRAGPKTQSALLEAMEERQVTVERERLELGERFVVLATQNPHEFEGTYPLPESQLDRFMLRLVVSYPGEAEEAAIVAHYGATMGGPRMEDVGFGSVEPALMAEARTQAAVVHASEALVGYVLRIAAATRGNPSIALGMSTRAVLALIRAARIEAASRGADFVAPDDVKAVTPMVVAHRLVLTPEATLDGLSTTDLVARVLEQAPVTR